MRKMKLVGSRSIQGASKPESDWDYLAFSWYPPNIIWRLRRRGFHIQQNHKYGVATSNFLSLKNSSTNVNIILTSSPKFYKNFLKANRLAQRLRITNRDDRVKLFKSILYDK